jgi:hypothetical protein
MSNTLFFLVPIGVVAIAWSLCFVGCNDTFQFSAYSDTILLEPNLVAYWPLSDLIATLNVPGQTAGASDFSGHDHNGTYTVPPAYPNAQFSKAIPGPLVGRGTSLVPGDAGSAKNPLPASANFEGGFVSIPWNTPNSTPADLTSFTFEAWIQPNFSPSDLQGKFRWVVFSALGNNNTGFVIFIDENNNWNVMLGNGTTAPPVVVNPPVPLDPNNQNADIYLAVTFDSTNNNTFSLFLNPDSDTSAPPTPNFTTSSANYAAVGQSQQVTFFLGAGDNIDAQNPRTQANGTGAPLMPFQGRIQSVALYSSALGPDDVQLHFQNGASTS